MEAALECMRGLIPAAVDWTVLVPEEGQRLLAALKGSVAISESFLVETGAAIGAQDHLLSGCQAGKDQNLGPQVFDGGHLSGQAGGVGQKADAFGADADLGPRLGEEG